MGSVPKNESQIFKPCIVLVSAFGGIADKIIATANIAMLHDPGYKDKMLEIRNRHFERVNDLLGNENREFTLNEADTALINEHHI